jgi:hypothetical protein
MQNREELRKKGHDGSRKMTCRERGKKYHFQKGGGINIVFGPKYRPLGRYIDYMEGIYVHTYILYSTYNLCFALIMYV